MDWKWLFFSFEGRANRAKWWLSVLVFLVLSILIAFIVLPFLGFSVWRFILTRPGVSSVWL
jgi:uncharacterized membrane protein YhaH (DUF805 family)